MVKVSNDDVDYMLNALALSDGLKNALKSAKSTNFLPDEIANELRDLCVERLATHGF